MKNILLICIGVVAAAFVAIYVFKVPLNSFILFGLVLLCPLMHLFMMRGMHDDKMKHKH